MTLRESLRIRSVAAAAVALLLVPALASAEPRAGSTVEPAGDPKPEPDAVAADSGATAEPSEPEAGREPGQEADPGAPGASGDPDSDIVPDREALHVPVEVANATLISLEEGIDLALRRHPLLRAARHRVTAAKARVGQAKATYMPRIDGGLQYVWASENGSPASVHSVSGMSRTGGSRRPGLSWNDSFHNDLVVLAVNQVIYDFGRTKGAVGGQRVGVMLAEMNLTLLEQQIAFGVMQAFYEVRAAREMVRVAEDILVTAQAILELANAARTVGLKPPSESARAEANVAVAEVALIQARARLEISRAAVAGRLGVIDEVYLPKADDTAPGDVPEEDRSIELALRDRPELEVLGLRREGLAQDLHRVKAQRYPRFDARASVNARGQFLPSAGQAPYQQFNWNVGVVISIPVFQGYAVKRRMEEIEAQTEVVDANRELVRQAVTVEVRQALARVRAADAAVVASQRGVEAARTALETLEGRYREGLAKLVELTDAQAAFIDARTQLVQVTYDRYLSRATLRLAMGQLP